MTSQEVEKLEAARCAAMLEPDIEALARLLHDDLRWGHASGKVDTKQAMLAQFGEGSMRMFSLNRSVTEIRLFGDCAVVTGEVLMDAMNGGTRRAVHSRYTGVWSACQGEPQLVAWQSARLG